MGKGTIVGLVLAGLLVVVGVIIFMVGVGYKNEEVVLRNQADAQQDANKVVFDKTWKTIKQKAGVVDKYADDFKGIYAGLMKSRYQGDQKNNPMFKWIQERNPDFSVELYKDLSAAIESNRAEFLRVQKRIIDIKREHDNLRMVWPAKIWVGGVAELEIQIITSEKTETVFKTGKEEDVDLF